LMFGRALKAATSIEKQAVISTHEAMTTKKRTSALHMDDS
jgi:hypothetical protein